MLIWKGDSGNIMNYNYLRYFSVLAQVEHYTIAAARLGISQPSLSAAINNLENALGGVQLFEKVGRNIRLTEEGKFYQQKVDVALEQLHSASIMLKSSRDTAPVVIRLGVVSGGLNGLLAEKVAEYSKKYKRVRFRITESSSMELMDMIRQEKLDMAIVDSTDRDRTLHFKKLQERNLNIALPADHPLAQNTELDPHEVMDLPQIVINYDVGNSFAQWASGAPTDQNIVCTVNTTQTAIDLVSSGLGIAFISDECIQERDDVVFIPLRNWHQGLYMCILYDKWLRPIIWEFRDLVVRSFEYANK
ncbi:MAG: LysR family transcriptional regulator [Christensenellaceae bacterium]|nr:LysR family transcriptional regulator [Christensenellaceae bacterium]